MLRTLEACPSSGGMFERVFCKKIYIKKRKSRLRRDDSPLATLIFMSSLFWDLQAQEVHANHTVQTECRTAKVATLFRTLQKTIGGDEC